MPTKKKANQLDWNSEFCQRSENPFSALTSEEQVAIVRVAEHKVYKRGEAIFEAGNPVDGIYSIISGVVKITQPLADKDLTVRLATPGEWVGHRSVFTSDTYRGSALAKERVEALFVPTNSLLKLFSDNKDFAQLLIRLIARDLERTERLLVEQQKLNVPSRLISLFKLLDKSLGENCGDVRRLTTKLSKVELAEMVGASQEVVSRQLSIWKKEKLIWEEGKQIHLTRRLLSRVIR